MSSKLFIVLLVASVASISLGDEPSCPKERLTTCTQGFTRFARENTPVPESIDDVRKYCEEIKASSRCVKGYFKECANPTARQMGRVVMSGVTKRINKNCSPAGMTEILKHTTCMKAVRGPFRLCYKQAVKDLYTIQQSPNKQNWHSLTCCFGSRAHDCAVNAVKANCEGAPVEYFAKESTQMTEELMDTFCSPSLTWGKSECAELIQDLPDVSMPKDKNVTIIPLLMEIMKEFTMDEEDL